MGISRSKRQNNSGEISMSIKLINSEIIKSGIISVTINNDKKKNALSEEIKIEMTYFGLSSLV